MTQRPKTQNQRPSTPKTPGQLRAIFGLAKQRGLEKEQIEDIAFDLSGDQRLSHLSFRHANVIIVRLGGEAFGAGTFGRRKQAPRRTENYRRQKAGVKQIAQPAHLDLMYSLAAGRGMSSDGLERMGRRMLRGVWPPRTTEETNKIVEALKAMNARDPQKEAA